MRSIADNSARIGLNRRKKTMPQNNTDYAVVIGIKDYPAFDNKLQGPVNDAQAFYDWVISEAGGDIPPEQVTLITSSQYQPPPFPDPKSARPMVIDVQNAFIGLQEIAAQSKAANNGYRVGRRLYIYMSGHGFAPSFEETGLLMANATAELVGSTYHILGQYTADWFFKAGCFEEVFLFMDCCRELFTVQGFNKSFKEKNLPGAITHVKRFYALATMWSGLAKEKDIDGVRHGIFTDALLKGLKGAASNINTGKLTALSLKNFIYTAMGQNSTPEIKIYPDIGEGFLIQEMPVPKFEVEIHLPPEAVGQNIWILDGTDASTMVRNENNAPAIWQVNLTRGKYLIQVLTRGLQKVIHVDGTGGLRVDL